MIKFDSIEPKIFFTLPHYSNNCLLYIYSVYSKKSKREMSEKKLNE